MSGKKSELDLLDVAESQVSILKDIERMADIVQTLAVAVAVQDALIKALISAHPSKRELKNIIRYLSSESITNLAVAAMFNKKRKKSDEKLNIAFSLWRSLIESLPD